MDNPSIYLAAVTFVYAMYTNLFMSKESKEIRAMIRDLLSIARIDGDQILSLKVRIDKLEERIKDLEGRE